jgi:hypothetical protein
MVILTVTHVCDGCRRIETESSEADMFGDYTPTPLDGWAQVFDETDNNPRNLCPECVVKESGDPATAPKVYRRPSVSDTVNALRELRERRR